MITVGGFVPFTTIDFPGKLSAVVFTQGCPLRCPYCHNPELQIADAETSITWEYVMTVLMQRKKLLDGVVFSGGEPLLQTDLPDAIKEVKKLGFAVALHTSGVYLDRLEAVLPMVDWIGLDIKAPFNKYAKASGTAEGFEMGKRAEQSLNMILKAGVELEVRTTTDPRVVTPDDILSMAHVLSSKGVKTFALQEYRPINTGKIPEPSMADIKAFYTDKDFEAKLKKLFPNFIMRKE